MGFLTFNWLENTAKKLYTFTGRLLCCSLRTETTPVKALPWNVMKQNVRTGSLWKIYLRAVKLRSQQVALSDGWCLTLCTCGLQKVLAITWSHCPQVSPGAHNGRPLGNYSMLMSSPDGSLCCCFSSVQPRETGNRLVRGNRRDR